MDVPTAARERFDDFVDAPLTKTRAEKKRFAPFADTVRAEDAHGLPTRVVDATTALLGRVERSTSPLHVRLIHATARFVSDGDDPGATRDWRLAADVVDAVAYTARHFDLIIGRD